MPSFSLPLHSELLLPICDIFVYREIRNLEEFVRFKDEIIKNHFKALIDTGANQSCISDRLAQELQLESVANDSTVNTAGRVVAPVYEVSLFLPAPRQAAARASSGEGDVGTDVRPFLKQRVYQIKYTEGNVFDVIIGMDLIQQGHLTIVGGSFHFTF
ncbi:MAG: retroviral-like aspartic protease family protein [Hyphomicrobiales bacterium]|nr:retroviral-like aspartic protease family protein [Hyphomicrobiales bacterium]